MKDSFFPCLCPLAQVLASYCPCLCASQPSTLSMSQVFPSPQKSFICGYRDEDLNAVQAIKAGGIVRHHSSQLLLWLKKHFLIKLARPWQYLVWALADATCRPARLACGTLKLHITTVITSSSLIQLLGILNTILHLIKAENICFSI